MSSLDLRKLHQLHLIDLAIVEIKRAAAALDPGKTIMGKIAKLGEVRDAAAKELHDLTAEQKDLELRQKSIDEKLKKFNGEIYGGKIVNPREVENLEKEVANQKALRASLDDRLFELMELIPPAEQALKEAEAPIDELKKDLAEFQKQVLVKKKSLEDDYRAKSAARPAAEKEVNPSMLARYNAIKLKCGGVGMADIKKNACSMCGTNVATKLIEGAKDGRIVTCESCHRILYASDGLI